MRGGHGWSCSDHGDDDGDDVGDLGAAHWELCPLTDFFLLVQSAMELQTLRELRVSVLCVNQA